MQALVWSHLVCNAGPRDRKKRKKRRNAKGFRRAEHAL
jgi:hypothetical protein